MSVAPHLRFEPKLLIDHVSPSGSNVTAVRGSLVLGSLKVLRETGYYAAYERALPEADREALIFALASSWVPASLMLSHFRTIDALGHSDVQLSRLGETLGNQIMESLFASLVRAARMAGAEAGIWLALKQADRIWTRMYQGGGVVVVQTGPKDATLEAVGLPFAASRHFRLSHVAFIRAAILMVAKACVARPVAARAPDQDRLAIALSWV